MFNLRNKCVKMTCTSLIWCLLLLYDCGVVVDHARITRATRVRLPNPAHLFSNFRHLGNTLFVIKVVLWEHVWKLIFSTAKTAKLYNLFPFKMQLREYRISRLFGGAGPRTPRKRRCVNIHICQASPLPGSYLPTPS